MSETYQDALQRYAQKRLVALDEAERRLRDYFAIHDLCLTAIDDAALWAWKNQWTPDPRRDGGWDWEHHVRRIRKRPRSFEIALWVADDLWGLAIGVCNQTKHILSIKLLEGRAKANPLKGFVGVCVAEAATIYGAVVVCSELRVVQPLPGALPIYRRLGFELPFGYTIPENAAMTRATRCPAYCFRPIMAG